MKRSILLIVGIFYMHLASCQSFEKKFISNEDPYHFYVLDGDSTEVYYFELVPENPKGVLTIIPSAGEKIENLIQNTDFYKNAYNEGYLVIIPSYNWGTVRRIVDAQFFDTIFQKVILDHKVDKNNFFLCGLSNGGVMALSYSIQAERDSTTIVMPKGIIGIDPPLDLIRLYHYCEREIKRNYSETGVQEAEWLIKLYNMAFGGPPEEAREHYVHSSIYTHDEESGGNAQYLNKTNILMYSDLNIDFLINQRRRNLNDWNGSDIIAFINQVKLNGNENAEVVISQNKGRRANGQVNPHSWNILDINKTLEWMNQLIEQ